MDDAPGLIADAADTADLTHAEEIRLRYAAIVESSDDAIIAKTLDGVICAWNPAAERMFGYTEREAIGQPIAMIIPSDRYDEEHGILRRLRAGERIDHVEDECHVLGHGQDVAVAAFADCEQVGDDPIDVGDQDHVHVRRLLGRRGGVLGIVGRVVLVVGQAVHVRRTALRAHAA